MFFLIYSPVKLFWDWRIVVGMQSHLLVLYMNVFRRLALFMSAQDIRGHKSRQRAADLGLGKWKSRENLGNQLTGDGTAGELKRKRALKVKPRGWRYATTIVKHSGYETSKNIQCCRDIGVKQIRAQSPQPFDFRGYFAKVSLNMGSRRMYAVEVCSFTG